jgi:hypothetical protein
MLELLKQCPHLQGEIILQDRPFVLDKIPDSDLPGITKQVHDFFTPQPVLGAKMYYIRRVMHDWNDTDVCRILTNIKPAMASDSRIIVSDMALPEPVTTRDAGAIWLDIMMLSIGGKERTKGDWERLGQTSGLRLVKVWQEPEKFGPLCVVEYALPEGEKGVTPNGAAETVQTNGTAASGEIDSSTAKTGTVSAGGVPDEAEMGGTTPKLSATADEFVPATTGSGPGIDGSNVMNLDSTDQTETNAGTGTAANETGRERDVDWEEGTVVGDREGSVEPTFNST